MTQKDHETDVDALLDRMFVEGLDASEEDTDAGLSRSEKLAVVIGSLRAGALSEHLDRVALVRLASELGQRLGLAFRHEQEGEAIAELYLEDRSISLLDALEAIQRRFLEEQAAEEGTEPSRVRRYTSAPESYDGFGTKTRRSQIGTDQSGASLREVSIEEEYLRWQATRYASGLHSCLTLEELRERVTHGFIELSATL